MAAMVTAPSSSDPPPPPAVVGSLASEYAVLVEHLASLETEERVKALPHLLEPAPPVDIGDLDRSPPNAAVGGHDAEADGEGGEGGGGGGSCSSSCSGRPDGGRSPPDHVASLRRRNLRSFSLTLLLPASGPTPTSSFSSFGDPSLSRLRVLDVGNNELSSLPGLSTLTSLTTLILTRNWFSTLPIEIGSLLHLRRIDASRNFFRPNSSSLLFDKLRSLPELRILDLTYNQKCGRPNHVPLIKSELPQLTDVKVTVWEKICSNPGAYVGSSAAERDATLLRSQLEPWGTVQLRRRLVVDFGTEPTDPNAVDRAAVMDRLLDCYRREGLLVLGEEEGGSGSGSNLNDGRAKRRTVRVQGTPVRRDLLDDLLAELRSWRGDGTRGGSPKNRERPSIKATCYMILRAPDANDRKLEGQKPEQSPSSSSGEQSQSSRRAKRTAKKMARNRNLWDMAMEAMRTVDPAFAGRCTELAVTFGFRGSPHIDKQNCGPFYGLALGKFSEGTGQICVECSARVVATVDTHNRLGRVDGRYPHWVTPYDADNEERFSLIYYETGGRFEKAGPAIFDRPV